MDSTYMTQLDKKIENIQHESFKQLKKDNKDKDSIINNDIKIQNDFVKISLSKDIIITKDSIDLVKVYKQNNKLEKKLNTYTKIISIGYIIIIVETILYLLK